MATMMGAYRLLLVCVFCALWGGAATAIEMSLLGAKSTGFVKSAQGAEELGDKAVKAQAAVVESAGKLLGDLEKALNTVKTAITGNEEKAKNAIAAVDKAVAKAKKANDTAQEVETDVKAADAKAKKLVTEAEKVTTGVEAVDDMKQWATTLKEIADEAAALWQTAQNKAKSQSTETDDALAEVQTAKTATDTDVKSLAGAPSTVKTALETLSTTLESLTTGPNKLKTVTKAAEQAVHEALKASTGTAKEADDLVKAADADTPQEAVIVRKNPKVQLNVLGKKNNNFSLDGSPLTVSHLATTFVLFFFARMAAVVITA